MNANHLSYFLSFLLFHFFVSVSFSSINIICILYTENTHTPGFNCDKEERKYMTDYPQEMNGIHHRWRKKGSEQQWKSTKGASDKIGEFVYMEQTTIKNLSWNIQESHAEWNSLCCHSLSNLLAKKILVHHKLKQRMRNKQLSFFSAAASWGFCRFRRVEWKKSPERKATKDKFKAFLEDLVGEWTRQGHEIIEMIFD